MHRVDQQFGGLGWEEGKHAIFPFPLNMFSSVHHLVSTCIRAELRDYSVTQFPYLQIGGALYSVRMIWEVRKSMWEAFEKKTNKCERL